MLQRRESRSRSIQVRRLVMRWIWVALVSCTVGSLQAGSDVASIGADRNPKSLQWASDNRLDVAARPTAGSRARGRLMSRVSNQLESISVMRQTTAPGRELDDHFLFESMSHDVRRGVERTIRKTVRDYLLEVTQLDLTVRSIVERHRARARREEAPAGDVLAREEPRKVRFDLGVSHARPELEMRYGLRRGSLRMRLHTDGSTSLSFRPGRSNRGEIAAGFDPDHGYRLDLRLSF